MFPLLCLVLSVLTTGGQVGGQASGFADWLIGGRAGRHLSVQVRRLAGWRAGGQAGWLEAGRWSR